MTIPINQFKDLSDAEKNRVLENVLCYMFLNELSPVEEQNMLDLLDHLAPYQVTSFILAIMNACGSSHHHLVWNSTKIISGKIAMKAGTLTADASFVMYGFKKAIEDATEDPLKIDTVREDMYNIINSLLVPYFDNILPRLQKAQSK